MRSFPFDIQHYWNLLLSQRERKEGEKKIYMNTKKALTIIFLPIKLTRPQWHVKERKTNSCWRSNKNDVWRSHKNECVIFQCCVAILTRFSQIIDDFFPQTSIVLWKNKRKQKKHICNMVETTLIFFFQSFCSERKRKSNKIRIARSTHWIIKFSAKHYE
jgi:hypothetical protein